jgi:DNA-binding transcriptional LysR family regulator
MSLNTRSLKSFAVLARTGSFTRAAARLHMSQPALTVQIHGLETALAARLFDRNTREVRLTGIGAAILPAVDRLLRDMELISSHARELAAGSIGVVHVAALPSVSSTVLPRAIARLRETHPGIVVSLVDTVAQKVFAAVRAETADFGIGVFAAIDRDMAFEPLLVDELEAVMAPDHPLAARKRLRLEDLADEPLIMMDSQSSVRALVEDVMARRKRAAAPAYEVTYMSTAVGLARAGLGVTLVPSSALELETVAGLVRRSVEAPGLRRRVGILRIAKRTLSPAAEIFLAVLREAARESGLGRRAPGTARRGRSRATRLL